MHSFISSQVNNSPTPEVIDLCLDHRLIADLHPGKFSAIAGLELLPNLRIFSASQHEIASTKGIANAPLLEEVDLNLNALQDLEDLDKLLNLKRLNLSHNELESDQLELLPGSVQTLDLGFNQIGELGHLGRLKRLESLTLNGNRRIQSLDGLPVQLSELNIAQAFVQDFMALAGLAGLRQLSLASGSRLALAPLMSHPALEVLRLTPHPVSTVVDLPPIPRLHTLRILKATNVLTISGLSRLPELRHLEITQSQLAALPDLSANTALETLEVKFSPIRSLGKLEELENLRLLVLKGTAISLEEVRRMRELRPGLVVEVG